MFCSYTRYKGHGDFVLVAKACLSRDDKVLPINKLDPRFFHIPDHPVIVPLNANAHASEHLDVVPPPFLKVIERDLDRIDFTTSVRLQTREEQLEMAQMHLQPHSLLSRLMGAVTTSHGTSTPP